MSTTAVAPNTLHKNLQILSLAEGIFSNTERAAVFEICHTVQKFLSAKQQLTKYEITWEKTEIYNCIYKCKGKNKFYVLLRVNFTYIVMVIIITTI
jgi:hypothetical protein